MFDSPAVAARVGESRTNTELFGEMMRRFGITRQGDATTDDEIVATPVSATNPVMFVDVFPGTPDRKVHLMPEALDHEATNGLYRYVGDPGSVEYPLALISPALATQISSYFGQLRSAPGELEISKGDAAARGIRQGDTVRVWNTLGEVHCLAKVDANVRDGVCVLAKGLWRKHTFNGFTSNALVPQTCADLGGQAAYNDARVQVEKHAHEFKRALGVKAS